MQALPPKTPRSSRPILRRLARLALKLAGWKVAGDIPNEEKLLIAAAPHTSNWDFIVAVCYILALDLNISIMMKREAFFWPVGGLWKRLGFTPINRQQAGGIVGQITEKFKRSEQYWLLLTPEGTRSAVSRWKSGFLRIAHSADVPVLLLSLDYPSRTVSFGKVIRSNGDIDRELHEVVAYFDGFTGKNPG